MKDKGWTVVRWAPPNHSLPWVGLPVVSRIGSRRALSWEDDTLFVFLFFSFFFFLGSFASDCQPGVWPSEDTVLLIVCESI